MKFTQKLRDKVWGLILHPFPHCPVYRNNILDKNDDCDSCSGQEKGRELFRKWNCEKCPFFRSQDKWTSRTV